MANWQKILIHVTNDVENKYDELKDRLVNMLGGPGKIKIVPYRAFGTRNKIYVRGRVLEDQQVTPATENDDLWDNLLNTYKRFNSHEIRYAQVNCKIGATDQVVTADEEGHFEAWLDLVTPLPENRLWHEVNLALVKPHVVSGELPPSTCAEILVPPPSAQYLVISDIDDTVVKTDATSMIKMARNVFLGNAETRLPFPGVAAFYRALYAGVSGDNQNPLFYVSSSPWNLYDLLVEFFHLHDIPIGPVLFLRDWGINREELIPVDNRAYKAETIRKILDFYPTLPVILVGDSGQQDPEIYADISHDYSDRILAVYIRNVSRNLKRPEAIRRLAQKMLQSGSTLILADDTYALAKHAAQKGWIQTESLPDIKEEKKKDKKPPTLVEKLTGEDVPQAETPTIHVQTQDENKAQNMVQSALEKQGDKTDSQPPKVIVEQPKGKRKDRPLK